MASASSKLGGLTVAIRVLVPAALASAGYAAWRVRWPVVLRGFFTGPGRSSRILLLLFALLNARTLPFAWTARVFYTIIYHNLLRPSPRLTPRALFKPIISSTRTTLLEMDYNLHKSNSCYFADLDVSRTHLVASLFRPALRALAHKSQTRLVTDPRATSSPPPAARGSLSIILGAVACSFRREIPVYKAYELWSRVLAWDRKWVYVVTHFVPKCTARPTGWLDPRCRRTAKRDPRELPNGLEPQLYASAISKYVFKLGRLTVHPAVILDASGLLPERPEGWTSGDEKVGDEAVDVGAHDLDQDGEWDWRRVEAQRRQGMKLAGQFRGLDDSHALFDGGIQGALGEFGPG